MENSSDIPMAESIPDRRHLSVEQRPAASEPLFIFKRADRARASLGHDFFRELLMAEQLMSSARFEILPTVRAQRYDDLQGQ